MISKKSLEFCFLSSPFIASLSPVTTWVSLSNGRYSLDHLGLSHQTESPSVELKSPHEMKMALGHSVNTRPPLSFSHVRPLNYSLALRGSGERRWWSRQSDNCGIPELISKALYMCTDFLLCTWLKRSSVLSLIQRNSNICCSLEVL